MSRNRKITLILSLFFSLLATFLLWQKIRKDEQKSREDRKSVRILVAGKDVHPGDILNADTLQVMEMAEDGYFPRMIKEADYPSIEGALGKNSIQKGNPILWDDLKNPVDLSRYSFSIEVGKRALSIPADANVTFSGLLRPGDHVDIYLTDQQQSDRGSKTILLLENIQVSAVDANFTDTDVGEDEFSADTVSLIVSSLQASSLLTALFDSSKKLGFVLRNPGDRKKMANKRKKGPTARIIEIFRMGKLSEKMRKHR